MEVLRHTLRTMVDLPLPGILTLLPKALIRTTSRRWSAAILPPRRSSHGNWPTSPAAMAALPPSLPTGFQLLASISSQLIPIAWLLSVLVSRFYPSLTSRMLTFCPFLEGMGLATDSDGSYPFGYSEGNDFEATLAISTVDFGTIHLYPSQCKL